MATELSLQVGVHMVAVIPAIGLGVVQLAMPKGTRVHRVIGRIWAVFMLLAAISSFWIRRDGFSWIHGLSVLTVVSVVAGYFYARAGNRRKHAGWMIGAFLGSIGAGIGALAPGRFLHSVLFFN